MMSFLTSWASFQPLIVLHDNPGLLSLTLLQLTLCMENFRDAQPEVGAMVRFLSTGPIQNLASTVNHIADVLAIFAPAELDHLPVQQLYNTHPRLIATPIIHPCWIFLWIAAFLAFSSKAAAEMLVRAQVDQHVANFCANNFHGFNVSASSCDHGTRVLLLQLVCHSLLMCINKHHTLNSPVMCYLANELDKENRFRITRFANETAVGISLGGVDITPNTNDELVIGKVFDSNNRKVYIKRPRQDDYVGKLFGGIHTRDGNDARWHFMAGYSGLVFPAEAMGPAGPTCLRS